jgi:hypothetical protein
MNAATHGWECMHMPTVELTDEQVVDLVKQLSPDRRREALLALAEGAAAGREERAKYAEAQLRRLAVKGGLDWDNMSGEERESFINDLVHEDRPCRT